MARGKREPPGIGEGGDRDENLERYESWRHPPHSVPTESREAFDDREAVRSASQSATLRGGVSGTPRSRRMAVDDDAAAEPGADDPRTIGRERRYRATSTGLRAEPGPRVRRATPLLPRQRADSRISEDVCDALSDDAFVDAAWLEVRVRGGEVRLEGVVSGERGRVRAGELAGRIAGVVGVDNRLQVARHEH